MTKSAVPFPQPAPVSSPEPAAATNRILIQIGKQRVVLEIWSQATVLSSPPAPPPVVVMARASRRNGQGSKPKS